MDSTGKSGELAVNSKIELCASSEGYELSNFKDWPTYFGYSVTVILNSLNIYKYHVQLLLNITQLS